MNRKFKEIFKGKVVNKALTTNTGVDEFPLYVVEYLIDNVTVWLVGGGISKASAGAVLG